MARGRRYRAPYSSIAMLTAVIAAYLLTRPYSGLYHDALLYAAQAVSRAGDAALAGDLFFRFGNQDSMMLFPNLQGWLTAEIGLTSTLMLLSVVQGVLWLVGLGMLARTIFPERRYWLLAMVITVLMGAGYGNAALSFGEGFVTARPSAEAFGMMALAFALRDQTRRSLLAILACGLCHPLVGLSVSGIWLTLAFTASVRLVTLVALSLALVLAVAQADIAPFSWLLETHDAEWGALLQKYESLGFMSAWGLTPLRVHALSIVILLIAAQSHDHLIETVAQAVLLVAVLFVSVSVIGADVFGNRLVAALQPWRVLSWVVLFGNVLVLHLLLRKPARSAVFIILLLAVAVNVTEHLVNVIPIFSSAMAVLVLLAHGTDRNGAIWRWINAFWAVLATLVVLALGSYVWIGDSVDLTDALLRIGTALVIVLIFLVRGRENMTLLAGAAFALAAVQIDRRDATLRFVESDRPLPPEVAETLKDETVYWEDGLAIVWVKLRQPNFYSCKQRAGTLFYRDQALEHERRGQALSPLNTLDFTQFPPGSCPPAADPSARGPAGGEAVRSVCEALPELDHIVLQHPVEGLDMSRWQLPIGADGMPAYHVACATFRNVPSDPPAPAQSPERQSEGPR